MDSEPTTFRPKPSFQFFYFLPALLAVAVAVDSVIAPDPSKWLVLAMVLALAAVTVPMSLTKVEFEHERLTLLAPLRRPRSLALNQLLDIEESSRLWHRLLLRYHPLNAQGRPDRTAEAFLSLPPLENQAVLVERLRSSSSGLENPG